MTSVNKRELLGLEMNHSLALLELSTPGTFQQRLLSCIRETNAWYWVKRKEFDVVIHE